MTREKKKSAQDVFIIDGLRTAIGSPNKSFKDFSAAALAAILIREFLERNNIAEEWVDEVILGNAVCAGTGQNLARQSAILGGLPASIPAYTLNHVCGGGLSALIQSARAIRSLDADLCLAGGTESASLAPEIVFKKGEESGDETMMVDSLVYDGLYCQLTEKHMGELCEYVVKKFGVTRDAQDQFALESHRKVCRAIGAGKLKEEIVPVQLNTGQMYAVDERPRKNIDLEKLSELPAVFGKQGTVTAGNSSHPSDGAAVVGVASADYVKNTKLAPKARILGYASIAVEPRKTFMAATPAIETCLKDAGLTLKDIDLFEVAEAFAAPVIITRNELKIPEEKLNIWGGDLALGHPLGAAGARIFVTLLNALKDQKKKRGLACIYLGGGGAVAVALERIS